MGLIECSDLFMRIRLLFIVCIGLVLTGCAQMPNQLSLGTQVSLTAANTIARLGGGYTVQRDIVFDAEHQLKLDWYRSDLCAQHCPLIIFFYGGGWTTGDKSQYLFAAQALTARGYQVVIPNYRLYPEVKFPDFLTDAAKAVAYVQQQNVQPLFLMGHSAGGYIAAMLATDPQYLAQQHLPRDVITAVAGIAGAYSFNPAETAYLPVFAHLQNTSQGFAPMQIDTRVQGSEPPMMLITGSKDVTVMQSNTDKLSAALNRVHSSVTLKQYPNLNHTQLMSVFVKPFRHRAPVVADVDGFFKQVKIEGI
jgi:hypothetical protein